jgi:cyclopropane-fatty-acyl-phospholipid synthase
LWAAERFRNSQITAVSNSASQRRYIEGEAAARGLTNVRVLTADMNDFTAEAGRFDRVVSVEMFEHMRNYELLLSRIAGWLRPDGKLFVHLFCHRDRCYPFEAEGAGNWMGRHFFSGGIMPSADLLTRFDRDLTVVRRQTWNGDHYRRTAEAWLRQLDGRRDDVLEIFRRDEPHAEARRRLNRWRIFFLAVAELFGYGGGEQWFVSHYLLERSR